MSKILVVDDSVAVLKIVKLALSSLGHAVVTCNTGEKAIEFLNSEQDFELGLFDFNLPGLTGIDLIRKALEVGNQPKLKIVVLSSENNPFLIQESKTAGAYTWIIKPFSNEELINQVNSLICD
jgi:two-component system chemotaxis response regulator CheY